MNYISIRKSLFIIIISAILMPLLIIIPNYFPFLGFSVSFIILSSFAFWYKKHKSNDDKVYYLFSLLFSLFLIIRANSFISFLNVIANIYLISFLALNYNKRKKERILNLFFLPLTTFLRVATIKSKYSYESLYKKVKDNTNKSRVSEITLSILVTVAVLFIVVPLLSYANPIFKELVQDFLSTINIFKNIDEKLFINITRAIFTFLLLLLLPKFLTYIQIDQKENKLSKSNTSNILFIPKVVVSALLAIFFITQAQLYFANSLTLQNLGISNSRYTREVFAQLSIVALVIFALIYNDKSKSKKAQYLTYTLITEGIFLTFIALKSVYEYSSTWGLTYKRLWGYTTVFWIIGILLVFLFYYYKKEKVSSLIKNIVLLTIVTLSLVNFVNFDKLIYKYRATTHDGIDYKYLSELSSDSNSYKQQVDEYLETYKSLKTDNKIIYPLTTTLVKIKNLQTKYNKLDFRAFNSSEFLTYLTVKDMNVDSITASLDKHNVTTSFHGYRISQKEENIIKTVKIYITNLPAKYYSSYINIYLTDKKFPTNGVNMHDNWFYHELGQGNFRAYFFKHDKSAYIESEEFVYTITKEDLETKVIYIEIDFDEKKAENKNNYPTAEINIEPKISPVKIDVSEKF